MKTILLSSAAAKVISEFSTEVYKVLSESLDELSEGHILTMPLSRPMNVVMPGVSELRLKDPHGIYRVFYYMKIKEHVLVFHAFQKKDQKTPIEEIETGRMRLKRMLREMGL